MSDRLTLAEIRSEALRLLDGSTWVTPTDVQRHLDLHGGDWYRVALVLERAAGDGVLELRGRGSRVRRYRRAAT